MFKKKEPKHVHDYSVIGYNHFTDPDTVYFIAGNTPVQSKGKNRTGVLYKCDTCGDNYQRSYGGHLTKQTIKKLNEKPIK